MARPTTSSSRLDTAASSSSASRRPRTGQSVSFAHTRPGTAGGQRPDTAESTVSTLAPLPSRTFRPDGVAEEDGDEEEGDESDEDDDEEGVFAYSRPQTGKVPPPPLSAGIGNLYPAPTGGSTSTTGDVFAHSFAGNHVSVGASSSAGGGGDGGLPTTSTSTALDMTSSTLSNSNDDYYHHPISPTNHTTFNRSISSDPNSLPTFAYSSSSSSSAPGPKPTSAHAPTRPSRLRSETIKTYDSAGHSSDRSSYQGEEAYDHAYTPNEHVHDEREEGPRGIPMRSFTNLMPDAVVRSDDGSGMSTPRDGRKSWLGSGRGSSRGGTAEGGRRPVSGLMSLGGTETIPDGNGNGVGGAEMREIGSGSGQGRFVPMGEAGMEDYEK